MALALQIGLYLFNDLFRLRGLAVNQQPAWALRQPQTHQQHQQAQYRTDPETQAPAQFGTYPLRIEQHNRANRAQRSTQPERAIDGQVDPAPVTRRGKFLDRRIDCGVLATDTHAGQKTEQHEAPDTE